MIDLKFLRENPDLVKENIKKKFQDHKLPLVDEVIEYDKKAREAQQEADDLRAKKNQVSKQIGALMAQGKKEEAEAVKAEVAQISKRLTELEPLEKEYQDKVLEDMMKIPNIIDPSVPIGKDDTFNVENEKFGEPVVPDFEIPYHTDIMERFDGIDLDAAGKVAGNGFYYLMGDIARLHSAMTAYARDFMIGKGFTYCIPPFMIRSNVVTGVMSFEEMDAMMYKIEGEDLYCSNLGDAQARRLKIRVKGEDGKKYFAHTLNNTVVAPPRMLIAFLENNLNADGSVNIPKALQPYMGGTEKLIPKH